MEDLARSSRKLALRSVSAPSLESSIRSGLWAALAQGRQSYCERDKKCEARAQWRFENLSNFHESPSLERFAAFSRLFSRFQEARAKPLGNRGKTGKKPF